MAVLVPVAGMLTGAIPLGPSDSTPGYCCAAPRSGNICQQMTLGQCNATNGAVFVSGQSQAESENCSYDVCGATGFCCVPNSPGAGQPGPGGCLNVSKQQCGLVTGAVWHLNNQAQCVASAIQNCGVQTSSAGSQGSAGSAASGGSSAGGASSRSVSSAGPLCGNGVLDAVEECEDRNTVNGDGCSSTCRIEPNFCAP